MDITARVAKTLINFHQNLNELKVARARLTVIVRSVVKTRAVAKGLKQGEAGV